MKDEESMPAHEFVSGDSPSVDRMIADRYRRTVWTLHDTQGEVLIDDAKAKELSPEPELRPLGCDEEENSDSSDSEGSQGPSSSSKGWSGPRHSGNQNGVSVKEVRKAVLEERNRYQEELDLLLEEVGEIPPQPDSEQVDSDGSQSMDGSSTIQPSFKDQQLEEALRYQLDYAIAMVQDSGDMASGSYQGLLPFAAKRKDQGLCAKCLGSGMSTCEYCKGKGFVQFGPGQNFNIRHKGTELTMPTHISGNQYYCPLCGGLRKERCLGCLGAGYVLIKDNSPITGTSKFKTVGESIAERTETSPNVETTPLGAVVIKRKMRRTKKDKKATQEGRTEPPSNGKRRRGRPRKVEGAVDIEEELTEGLRRAMRLRNNTGGTTDFLNTTAFKVAKSFRDEEDTNMEPGKTEPT